MILPKRSARPSRPEGGSGTEGESGTGHLAANPKEIPDGPAIIQDLQEFESVLGRLASERLGWHLAVDF